MERVLGICCLLALGGCEGIVGDRDLGADPSAYVEFNLTQDGDRAQFTATDLEYTGSVGPYAMFLVTGASPRLDGPEVHFAGGYAVLRGASTYFTPAQHASEVQVALAGSADAQLVALPQTAMRFAAGCATALDTPAQQLSSSVAVQRISVTVSPAPAVGSLVLLRRVVLSGAEPTVNQSETATVCCQSTDCALQ
jgi:hypothetical protein